RRVREERLEGGDRPLHSALRTPRVGHDAAGESQALECAPDVVTRSEGGERALIDRARELVQAGLDAREASLDAGEPDHALRGRGGGWTRLHAERVGCGAHPGDALA